MRPQEYITERDKVTKRAIDRLDEVLPKVQKEILKIVINRLDELDTDKDGRIKATGANLKVINDIVRKEARSVFLTEDYEDAVMEFVETYPELGKITRQYFNKIESARPTDKVT